MRILTFSTLFPNAAQPAHGVFVLRRLRKLVGSGRVEARVVAPVPWFPIRSVRFGAYAKYAEAPKSESIHGIEVLHPRYVVIPRIGMHITPVSLALGSVGALRAIRASGYDFDLIDAHYYYPDGVAAAMLGRLFCRPVVITARGTDINLIPGDALARRMILNAHRRSAFSVAVCRALKDEMVALGMREDRIEVLRNGVDLQSFRPVDRMKARESLGLARRRWLLSVGHLIERKGHHIAIQALRDLPDWGLIIAGDGPDKDALAALASKCGVTDRVVFAGLVAADRLPTYYSAADALVLASSREGWANVLLESMACGTPVVATNVWGTPECVTRPESGVLMDDRTPEALIRAIEKLIANYPSRDSTRKYSEGFGWESTTEGQLSLFERIVSGAT